MLRTAITPALVLVLCAGCGDDDEGSSNETPAATSTSGAATTGTGSGAGSGSGPGGSTGSGGAPGTGGGPGSGGDSSSSGSSTTTTGTGGAGGGHVRQNLLLDEGFEGADPFPEGVFSVGQACCDHTITASTEQAREGSQSFRAEVRVGDPAVSSGYRAELTMPGISDTGDKWYGWSMFFQAPADGGAWDGTNGHFTQWHPDNGSGSASLGLWSYGDGWLVGLNPEGDGDVELEDLGMPIEVGAWQDVVMHVDWDEGIVEVWVNGVQELAAANVDFASGPGQYMKLGINRWGSGPDGSPADDDWVIFYDAFRIGSELATYDDVAP